MTVVDSPIPSGDPPDRLAVHSGVPLELAELCGWQIHEIEIAVSLIAADRGVGHVEEAEELETALRYLDRLFGCVDATYYRQGPPPRDRISELITAERLNVDARMDLFTLSVWRWDGQIPDLIRLREHVQGRLARLDSIYGNAIDNAIGKEGGI